MVDIREERVQLTKAHGTPKGTGIVGQVWFNKELYDAIAKEARSRMWSFSHMVRFLCEASIDGIE